MVTRSLKGDMAEASAEGKLARVEHGKTVTSDRPST